MILVLSAISRPVNMSIDWSARSCSSLLLVIVIHAFFSHSSLPKRKEARLCATRPAYTQCARFPFIVSLSLCAVSECTAFGHGFIAQRQTRSMQRKVSHGFLFSSRFALVPFLVYLWMLFFFSFPFSSIFFLFRWSSCSSRPEYVHVWYFTRTSSIVLISHGPREISDSVNRFRENYRRWKEKKGREKQFSNPNSVLHWKRDWFFSVCRGRILNDLPSTANSADCNFTSSSFFGVLKLYQLSAMPCFSSRLVSR